MNLDEIRELMREGGRLVIVEEGKHPLVVFSFEEYRNKTQNAQSPSAVPYMEQRLVGAEDRVARPEFEEDELKIDDLPV